MHAAATALFAIVAFAGCRSNDSKQLLSHTQKASFALTSDPETFDPRIAQGLPAGNIMHMLFEGLTKVDSNGSVLAGAADQISVSPDMKTYTFVLKDSKWSNGDPVLAHDFSYSWRSQIKNQSAHSYLFSVIKGVGVSNDKPGITVVDEKTLQIELKEPTPYFLQLVATQAYFPVHRSWTEEHPDFTVDSQLACISNGPFQLHSYEPHGNITLRKNEQYWNNALVALQEVNFALSDDKQAFTTFKDRRLDWVGNPFTALSKEEIAILTEKKELESKPAFATAFVQINVTKDFFKDAAIRKAIALSIDTNKIVREAMSAGEIQASSFVPPGLGLAAPKEALRFDSALAKTEFASARNQQPGTELPTATLLYAKTARTDAIAAIIQSNLRDALGIELTLDGVESDEYLKKLVARDYSLALNSWMAEYYDPMSYLSLFSSATNGINTTGWSDKAYSALLYQSSAQMDQAKRFELLNQAQEILMQQMPIISLFHFSSTFGKSASLEGVFLSPLAIVELNTAFQKNITGG